MFLTLKDQHEHLSETVSHFKQIRIENVAEHQNHISQLREVNENCSAIMSQLENLNKQSMLTDFLCGVLVRASGSTVYNSTGVGAV